MSSQAPDIDAAAQILRARAGVEPELALVLGSGLGALGARLDEPLEIAFEALPGFPPSGVAGHAGRYLLGALDGVSVLVQEGRYHAYEGHAAEVVVAPVRLAAALGVRFLLLVSAVGGVDPLLAPGDLVLLDDHVNLFSGCHPLSGPVRGGERRFPDMSAPYDPALQRVALEVGARLGARLGRGTYAAVSGPSYETPAEVRMLGRLGADVVGMSTVPEVIVARALGLRCLGISVVTNRAAGLSHGPLSHDEVVVSARAVTELLGRLLIGMVRAIASLNEAQSGEAK